jgi:hypothetical protein
LHTQHRNTAIPDVALKVPGSWFQGMVMVSYLVEWERARQEGAV